MSVLRPVILSGGSGTRLWPLSSRVKPKQFIPLFGAKNLLKLTLDRLAGLNDTTGVLVVTGFAYLDLVRETLDQVTLPVHGVIVEPSGRNTAPAAFAAAFVANPSDVLVLLPADHLVQDNARFREGVAKAAGLAAEGSIVTFGVPATRPETGYGYIETGESLGPAHRIARFKEKPDHEEATRLVDSGGHLWNSGIFVTRADLLIDEGRRLCPDVIDGVEQALPDSLEGARVELGETFSSVRSLSLDHAVMEKTERGLVMSLEVGWDDVGSYASLLAVSQHDDRGNHLSGDVISSDVSASYVAATSRRVVVAGVEGLVVVETPDVVLVVPVDRSQEVRALQERASEE